MTSEKANNNGKTWFIDIDGVIFEHNRYLQQDTDLEIALPGVKELFSRIPKDDVIILVTARDSAYKDKTVKSLEYNNLRFNFLIMDLPTGPRVLINDSKPDGTKTAYSFNLPRNVGISTCLLSKMT